MKKAELEQRVKELETLLSNKQKGVNTMSNKQQTKGEQTMENAEKKEFNSFAYVKGALLQEYLKNKIAGKSVDELTFSIRNYYQNSFVLNYLNKQGALKVANVAIDEKVNSEGKLIKTYNITVTDLNINATATSKAGKEFRLFDDRTIGRAMAKLAI